jgi:capsular exopolysaccharide synthesis family protein
VIIPSRTRAPNGTLSDSILNEDRLRLATSEPSDPDDEQSLVEKLLRLLRKRWLIVLQAVVVIPLAALLFSLAQDKEWTATSTLLVQPARQNSGSVDLTRQAATQAELVGLPVVAARTAERLGDGWTTAKVQYVVDVSASTDTNLININATTAPAEAAQSVANVYARSFIDLQDESNAADVRRRLAAYDAYFRSLPTSERTGPRAERLQQRLDALRISSTLNSDNQSPTAQLMQPAELPSSPSSPKVERNVILALLLGVIVGISLAALLERLDRGISSIDELERISGLPILARIPRARGLDKRLRRTGSAEVLRSGAEAEAFRALRASLRYFNVDGNLRSLLVVSPEAEDGKSTVAACLATTLAQRGDRVILVEADLHKRTGEGRSRGGGMSPAGAVGAGDEHAQGLTTVLAGGDLDDALLVVPLDGGDGAQRELIVLPSGPTPPNPSELLESRRMHELMMELQRRCDVVVYDTPALSAVSDALALVPDTAGVIVVSRLHHTSRDTARELLKQLALLRAHVLGVVANCSEVPKRRGYDYYRA